MSSLGLCAHACENLHRACFERKFELRGTRRSHLSGIAGGILQKCRIRLIRSEANLLESGYAVHEQSK